MLIEIFGNASFAYKQVHLYSKLEIKFESLVNSKISHLVKLKVKKDSQKETFFDSLKFVTPKI
jgi:hypothetical protein